MPRDITVTFEDGSSHVYKNAPDAITPEQVSERASVEFQKPVKALDGGNKTHPLRKGLNSFIAGFGKVAADVPRAVMNVLPFPDEAAQNAYQASDDIRAYYDDVGKRGASGYTGAALEGAGAAMAGGGAAAPARAFAGGVGSGLGSEAAGSMFGDNALARTIGGILGGLVGAGGANAIAERMKGMTPRAADLAQKALRGVDEGMLQKAEEFQKFSAKNGVTVDLAQALEAVGAPSGTIKNVRNFLANHEAGENVQKVLQTQPKELDMLATTTVAKLPGQVLQPDTAANNVQQAATARINVEKSARSGAVRNLYSQAGELPEGVRQNLIDVVDAAMNYPGAADGIKAAGKELKRKFGVGGISLDQLERARDLARQAIATAPNASTRLELQRKLAAMNAAIDEAQVTKPLHALDVDTAISEAAGQFKGTPLTPTDPKTSGQMKRLAGDLNRTLQEGSPEIAEAERLYSTISRTKVDPLKQGPVGQLATPRGAKPDVQASVAKLNSIFSEGVDPQALGPSKVLTLAKELKQVDPQAFPDAAKTYLSGRLASVNFNGKNPADELAKAMFDNPKQYQGLRDMAAGIADSHGLKREEVVRGLDNLEKITKAIRSRPETVGGLDGKEILETSGKSVIANAMRVFGFLPFERTARGIENFVSTRTLKEFDKLLTSPEGAKTLAQLGKVDPRSPKAIALLANFSVLSADTQAEPAN